MVSVQHLRCRCSPTSGSCGSSSGTVSDLSVIAATASCSSSCATLYDDVTGTSLNGISNAHVGMYVLGEEVGTIGYSRFTTSKSVPTWIVGSSSVSGSCSSTSPGSLYSNTTGTLGSTFYVCTGTTWTDVK